MEIWKDVVGFEGIYQVSSHGRVKTTYKQQRRKDKDGYLCAFKNEGYQMLALWKNGDRKMCKVSLIVARAFLGESKGKVCDHINRDRADDRLENLRYVTRRENLINSHAYENYKKTGRGWIKKNKPICLLAPAGT